MYVILCVLVGSNILAVICVKRELTHDGFRWLTAGARSFCFGVARPITRQTKIKIHHPRDAHSYCFAAHGMRHRGNMRRKAWTLELSVCNSNAYHARGRTSTTGEPADWSPEYATLTNITRGGGGEGPTREPADFPGMIQTLSSQPPWT